MKFKFFLIVILGIINAIVICIYIQNQGFSNSVLQIKELIHKNKLVNEKILKGTYINKDEIVKEENNEDDILSKPKQQIKNRDNIKKEIKSDIYIDNKTEIDKDINNKTENVKKDKNKPISMAEFDISHIVTGPLDVNCYIIGDPKSKKALVIDPGGSPEEILNICKEKGFELESIYLTHAHFDHMLGIYGLREKTEAKIYLHEDDAALYRMLPLQVKFFGFGSHVSTKELIIPDPDVYIKEGDHVMINGEPVAKIYHTPGHSPGSVCFHFEKINKMYTGDTLFRSSVGRTDLWQGSYEQIRNSVRGKLFKMDDNIEVYPGHGPSSSIGYEKTHNFSV
jgi:glyoxylase-like metal-dependent hydrolase (beta-lactamase superfamily II)